MDNSKKLTLFMDGYSQGSGFIDISVQNSRILAKILGLNYIEVKGLLSKSALLSMIMNDQTCVQRKSKEAQDSSCPTTKDSICSQDSCCGGGVGCFVISPPTA